MGLGMVCGTWKWRPRTFNEDLKTSLDETVCVEQKQKV